MRAVNLLPQDSSRGRFVGSKNLPAVVGGGLGVVVVAALAGGYLMQTAKIADARRGLDAAKAQLAATPLPPPPPKVPLTPAAVTSQEQPRLQAVAAALSQRIAWDRILREFSLVLPNDVWLSSLNLSAPAAGGGTGLQITGSTYSYDSVARLLSRLSLIPDLAEVSLGTTTTNGKLVTFDAKASVKGAPAPAVPAPPAATGTTTTTTPTSGATS
jgi:Tfp pilus assembly protein PilN